MNRYDSVLKLKIIEEAKNKKFSTRFLAEKYKINQNTIKYWVYTQKPENRKRIPVFERKRFLENNNQILQEFFKFANLDIKTKKEFIKENSKKFSINFLCKILKISSATLYYKSKKEENDWKDYLLIKEIFEKNHSCYGHRRLKIALWKEKGINFNHKKILRLMHKYDLFPNTARIIKNKNYHYKKRFNVIFQPNLVNQNFKVVEKNKIWFTDITYLNKNDKNKYLAGIIDGKTKELISYEIGDRNDWELVKKMLKKALKKISKEERKNPIIHSDRGSQFVSYGYRDFCKKNGIISSMSRKGNPIDNAPMESFFASMKKETLYNQEIKNMDDYLAKIKNWINFYNTTRIRYNENNFC